ncbi:SRPBCC domain-containing protein [Streptomyces sp. NPDC054784]|jgi:uncharacterized protein YndB with AHSA1/START domain
MTIRNLGDDTTTLTAEGTQLKLERPIDAPRSAVWAALTTPEHIQSWMGPRNTTAKVGDNDVKVGGKWSVTPAAEQGSDIVLSGEYKEVVENEKIVRTSVSSSDPEGNAATETLILEDNGGKTTLKYEIEVVSAEVLDGAIEFGMPKSVIEQFDRLAEVAPKLG